MTTPLQNTSPSKGVDTVIMSIGEARAAGWPERTPTGSFHLHGKWRRYRLINGRVERDRITFELEPMGDA